MTKITTGRKSAQFTLAKALKEILNSENFSTQEEICAVLQQHGFDVNQSRISRLLRKVGAIKTTNMQNEVVYSLPPEPVPPPATSPLSHLVIEVSNNHSLILVRTSPGSASLIARMLDHHRHALNLLGTVAGDDTILVIPVSNKDLTATKQAVVEFLSVLT